MLRALDGIVADSTGADSTGDVSSEVAHQQVMLLDAFLIRDDFHIVDCVVETR